MRTDSEEMQRTIAESTSQMVETTREISQNVSQTALIAEEADRDFDVTKSSLEQLGNETREIEKVVSVIQKMAEQTNLLALNATIEAARAGEYGKGFAVVASEVKELAQETGQSSDTIRKQIASIVARVSEVMSQANALEASVKSVSENTATMAAAVEEQSATMANLGDLTIRLKDA